MTMLVMLGIYIRRSDKASQHNATQMYTLTWLMHTNANDNARQLIHVIWYDDDVDKQNQVWWCSASHIPPPQFGCVSVCARDLYLSVVRMYRSSEQSVSHFLHRLISFSVNELTSCALLSSSQRWRRGTCALPGIVFNSKPRLILQPLYYMLRQQQ